jgi:hypothetical protein
MSTQRRKKPQTEPPHRIADMVQTVAAKTGMAADNPLVIDIARLEVAMAFEEKALEAGSYRFSAANLLNLRAALHDAYKSAGALQPRQIEIEIVEGVRGVYQCAKCGHENHLAPDRYTPLVSDDDKAKRDHRQIEANNSPSGDGKPSPAMPDSVPHRATETSADALNPAPAPTPADSVTPDRFRGEYMGPSGHIEVLPLKRLQRPDWHRNPDPADAAPRAVEQGLLR